ncbi:hypothetical protein D9615_009876 [Tricholomella constricta]|uniref:Uncharacterized protein n=1 Tax=Tricholomella constricta TaxID=117010 RepID=A0A8H5GXB1_9AGAR|nr:hypothetical protein D9615_009876 [Tricholomella constricta]
MGNRGKLLTYRESRRFRPGACYVYGFPLDEAGQDALGEKLCPTPPTSTSTELVKPQNKHLRVLFHLLSQCDAVWPSDRSKWATGTWEGEDYVLIGVAVCRIKNDEHIPKGGDMVKLKAIFAANGFIEEPRWFLYG